MRVRIAVGDVEIDVEGMEVTKADIARWFKRASLVAAALATVTSSDTEQPVGEAKDTDAHITLSAGDVPMFGFSRWIEGDPEIPDEDAP